MECKNLKASTTKALLKRKEVKKEEDPLVRKPEKKSGSFHILIYCRLIIAN